MTQIKFSIIVILLSFMTSCDNKYYLPNDKGVVVGIQGMANGNEVTIRLIGTVGNTYVTFYTHKQYSINDTIYFTNFEKS